MEIQAFNQWITSLKTNKIMTQLYSDEHVNNQIKRYSSMFDQYTKLFPHVEQVDIFSSPGRVEVCGNHTDHQLGQVVAMAVDLDTVAFAQKNNANIIRIISKDYIVNPVSLDDLLSRPNEQYTTTAMVRGIAFYFQQLNKQIGGFDAYIESTISSGSGLSSSASFEILITKILDYYYGVNTISITDYAIISQKAENNYFNKPCGLMDQLIIAHGGICGIDFYNKNMPVINKINEPTIFQSLDICIVQCGGSHSDLSDDYAEIFSDCKLLANHFNQTHLSRVQSEEFYNSLAQLYQLFDTRIIMRGYHYFKEIQRVQSILNALNTQDKEAFLTNIIESGQSSYQYLQNVINKHSSKQGLTLALLMAENELKDQGAWRVHGGGFAGTVLLFIPKEKTHQLKTSYEAVFKNNSFIKVHQREDGVLCLSE
jgi:galactokinase